MMNYHFWIATFMFFLIPFEYVYYKKVPITGDYMLKDFLVDLICLIIITLFVVVTVRRLRKHGTSQELRE
jgi:uncharacterized PurR-regulated membrane protein YhhQ (DUF165 family)